MANIGAASPSQPLNHVVQNLQPAGRHWLHIPAYTDTVQHQRSCIPFPTTTVQLCCLLQLVPSSYYSGLERTGDGSTTFPDCWCLQELPLHWSVMSSLPLLAWLLLAPRPPGNVAYPAAVCLSSLKKSHYQRKKKKKMKWVHWWLGGVVVRTSDLQLAVAGSPPGHDTAWLFISEIGDRLWWVNCLGNCNHHLSQLSLSSLQGR